MSQGVKERRAARIGTVSGLALLAGSTAVAAVSGGAHSIFATVLLGLLALGMSHALVVEIQRQAERRVPTWARQDSVNAFLLGCWAEAALIMTIVGSSPAPVRIVGLALTIGYAVSCGYFVTLRRRTIADLTPPVPAPSGDVPAPKGRAAPSTGRPDGVGFSHRSGSAG